ncbi:MAG: STT3 domain-containing protein [Desulfobulbales bacterium]|nr:STT3 domain-containing protein [Desulfobulbales bacterium]
MKELDKIIKTKTFTVAVLLTIMLFGFFLRFNDLEHWLDNKDQYFFNSGSLPVALGVDSYYYMDIANDLLQGKIERFKPQRRYPEGTHRQSPAPLLSVLLAVFAFIANQPLEWIAVLIPPFLGVLLAIPAYLLGYTLIISANIPWQKSYVPNITAAKTAGFCVAFFSLISPSFIKRSSIGWCDTDILNVMFVTLFIALATQISDIKKINARGRLFVTFAFSLVLFIWWWDQVLAPPLLLAGGPLLLSLFFIRFDSGKRVIRYICAFAFFFLILWIWKGDAFSQLPRSVMGILKYIFGKESAFFFPPLEQLVQEQNGSSFQSHALAVAGHTYIYILSIAGLIGLAFLSKKRFLFLAPLIALEALALEASRFDIFFAPLLGLGLGTIIFLCLAILHKHERLKIMVGVVLIVCLGFLPIHHTEHLPPPSPILDPVISEALKEISVTTPEEAVIWTSWGRGHPLVYYTGRNTLADGVYHPTSLQYILYFPLATSDFRLAANWIQFYTANGQQGLRKIFTILTGDANSWDSGIAGLAELLSAGVEKSRFILSNKHNINHARIEEILSFLFPPNCPPVYLFMDYELVEESWYKLGKRDLKRKIEPSSYTKLPIFSYRLKNSSIHGLSSAGDYTVNLNSGRLRLFDGENISLTNLIYSFRGNTYSRKYLPGKYMGHTLYLKQNEKHKVQFGVLVDNQTAKTVFINLFFEKQFAQDFFSPIIDQTPAYLLCKVHGEKYQEPSSRDD